MDADIEKRDFTAEQRRDYAKRGLALEDGSYPIPDEDALCRAAILARSGHGNVAAARRLISRRARELGVKNPLRSDKVRADFTDRETRHTPNGLHEAITAHHLASGWGVSTSGGPVGLELQPRDLLASSSKTYQGTCGDHPESNRNEGIPEVILQFRDYRHPASPTFGGQLRARPNVAAPRPSFHTAPLNANKGQAPGSQYTTRAPGE